MIVSTVNTLGRLRGAIIGRASSGAPTVYATLDRSVIAQLAPKVPDELGHHDLLAQHQLELQARAQSEYGVGLEDVEELRELQALIGAN